MEGVVWKGVVGEPMTLPVAETKLKLGPVHIS